MRYKSFFKWVCLFMFLSLVPIACDDGATSDHHDITTETGDDGEGQGGKEDTTRCPSECSDRCDTNGQCIPEETTCPEECLGNCDEHGQCLPDDVTCPDTCQNGCNADGSCACPDTCQKGCDANGVCVSDDVSCPDTCQNGCNADGSCACPDTCQNGCDAKGVCVPNDVTCPDTCQNGCNADGSCACPNTCKNGCNADGSCACPDTCQNGCNADGSCACPENCQNGCNADGACTCPSSCKTSCNPDGVCCKDNNCKGVCNNDGNCVTCDGGKAITQIRFVKPFTNSASKTTNISIAEWDLKKLKDASENNASKRTTDTMTIWVKTSDGTQYQMNDKSNKCKPEIALSCFDTDVNGSLDTSTGTAVKGSWNQSKGLLTIQSTTKAGSTTCTASLKNDKHINDSLNTRSLNFNALKDFQKFKVFAGQIQGNKSDPVFGDPSDNIVKNGVFDPQGFDFIDDDTFYFSRVCDNGKTTDGTPWRRSFCVHQNTKNDHSYTDAILQVPGAGHAQTLSYESGSPGYLWFANFGTLIDDKYMHGYQKTRILTRFPLDQKGKYNKNPKELPGTHYYYSKYKQNGKVYNQGVIWLEAAVDNLNNMIAIRGTIQSTQDPRHIWVYKLSNITDNLSTSQNDYVVYIEKTLNSFKNAIADIDQGSDGEGRKYTIDKSKLKDLSTVTELNTFNKDVPGAQGIALANGFIFFVKENIETVGSNQFKSTLTTHVFTYAGTQIGSGFSLEFDSSSTLFNSFQYDGKEYKFNGYVESEGIRYRNGKVYIFVKVRFNSDKLNNLRTAYILEIDIAQ